MLLRTVLTDDLKIYIQEKGRYYVRRVYGSDYSSTAVQMVYKAMKDVANARPIRTKAACLRLYIPNCVHVLNKSA